MVFHKKKGLRAADNRSVEVAVGQLVAGAHEADQRGFVAWANGPAIPLSSRIASPAPRRLAHLIQRLLSDDQLIHLNILNAEVILP